MSRVGKALIKIPADVTVKYDSNVISVSGKSGTLTKSVPANLVVTIADGNIKVECVREDKRSRAFWGLYRALINNMVVGISTGYKVDLEINGVGYRASTDGKILTLFLGYSHEIKVLIPQGIKVVSEKPTALAISGIDKEAVGQFAAQVRKLRKPERYKGKGIKYVDEVILRKVGKKK